MRQRHEQQLFQWQTVVWAQLAPHAKEPGQPPELPALLRYGVEEGEERESGEDMDEED